MKLQFSQGKPGKNQKATKPMKEKGNFGRCFSQTGSDCSFPRDRHRQPLPRPQTAPNPPSHAALPSTLASFRLPVRSRVSDAPPLLAEPSGCGCRRLAPRRFLAISCCEARDVQRNPGITVNCGHSRSHGSGLPGAFNSKKQSSVGKGRARASPAEEQDGVRLHRRARTRFFTYSYARTCSCARGVRPAGAVPQRREHRQVQAWVRGQRLCSGSRRCRAGGSEPTAGAAPGPGCGRRAPASGERGCAGGLRLCRGSAALRIVFLG